MVEIELLSHKLHRSQLISFNLVNQLILQVPLIVYLLMVMLISLQHVKMVNLVHYILLSMVVPKIMQQSGINLLLKLIWMNMPNLTILWLYFLKLVQVMTLLIVTLMDVGIGLVTLQQTTLTIKDHNPYFLEIWLKVLLKFEKLISIIYV